MVSDTIRLSRIDSEYYKPHFQQLKNHIYQYVNGWEYLLTNIESIGPSFNPFLQPNKDFNYIELSGINASLGIVNEYTALKGADAPGRARRIVQTGDIIASSVVGSVEKCALISAMENNFLASTGFFHFRSKYYDPFYLLLLLKSKIVIEQFKQEATGGILSAVPDPNLRRIIIPKIPKDIQSQIARLTERAHNAQRQSRLLLEQAKTEVETLIEQAAHTS